MSSLRTLISKLSDATRAATERAAGICVSHGHHEVDIEHLLLALLEAARADFSLLCRRFGVAVEGLREDLEAELRTFRSGNTRTPVFSERMRTWLEHAWLIASLESHDRRIRSGHLTLALLADPTLRQLALRTSRRFDRFEVAELQHRLAELTRESVEALDGGVPVGDDVPAPAGLETGSRTPALDRYTVALTQQARDGRIDPVIGRESEIRLLMDVLTRRRQNNPILVGEAGVGKTAVVEGLARRIVAGDVPPSLREVEMHVLDLGLLQAGASVKGEFEARLKGVIDEVRGSSRPIVLFIDEAHTMIGAGGAVGQNDAANLLKPVLARGELRVVAATTWSEYKKYFEKDAALARRFQLVKVEEPDEATAAAMLRSVIPLMEAHFGVRVLDEAVTEAVRLSTRYLGGRQLPDKAVGLLDTACARVAMSQTARPASLEDQDRSLAQLDLELAALTREATTGARHEAAIQSLEARRSAAAEHLETLVARHAQERQLVATMAELRERAEAGGRQPALVNDLRAAADRLAGLQEAGALVAAQVDGRVVAEVVSAWTGIPLGRMLHDEFRTVLGLAALLQARVLGQQAAVEAIAQRVRTAHARLEDPGKPRGVFLFAGPSGVGKTETALALADLLYGGEHKLITINMSEYQEAHSVAGLKGSPPGYVGYGEGGVLTEAIRRNPYSVLLLDEVEKAHPDVLELFFQVFDKGHMDDAEGRAADFRHCLIILTSNAGSAQVMQACLNRPAAERPSAAELAQLMRPALYRHFKPAFLGRLAVVPFYPVDDDTLDCIIRMKLDRIGGRMRDSHGAEFHYDAKVVQTVLARCTEVDSGARNVDHVLAGSLLPLVAEEVLQRLAAGSAVQRVQVRALKGGEFKCLVQ